MQRVVKYFGNFPESYESRSPMMGISYNRPSWAGSIIKDIGGMIGVDFVRSENLDNADLLIVNATLGNTGYREEPIPNRESYTGRTLIIVDTKEAELMKGIKIVNEKCIGMVGYYRDTILADQDSIFAALRNEI